MANLSSKIYNGLLPISAGGTGATTASAALTALGAQPALVSGTNIITINNTSLLGSGNLTINALSPTIVQTSLYTASAYDLVRCNSSSGTFDVNLPSSVTDGTLVGFLDVTGYCSTNPVRILPNSSGRSIEGDTQSLSLNISNAYVTFIYSSTSNNWKLTENPSSFYSATPDVPGAPTNVTATLSDTTATLTFNVPSYVGGSTITSYTATSSPGGIIGTKFGVVNQSGTETISVYNLLSNVSYTFTVTATNGAGTGTASSASNAVSLTVPGKPTGVSATISNTTATVYFTAPVSNGNSQIFKYTATVSPTLVTGNLTGIVNQSGNGSITITNLPYNTNYTFTVTATNAVGTSAASDPSNSVSVTVPGAPTIGTVTLSGTTATVPFTAPLSNGGMPITQYNISGSDGTVYSTITGIVYQSGNGTATITGLSLGVGYTFKVTATNVAGTSLPSAPSNSVINVDITISSVTDRLLINQAWIKSKTSWDGIIPITILKITNASNIYSTTTATAALIFAADLGTLPAGSATPTFINNANCYIAGRGGDGGAGGGGGNGGTAIQALAAVTFTNNGIVGGGGGGGGGKFGAGGGGWGGGTGASHSNGAAGGGGAGIGTFSIRGGVGGQYGAYTGGDGSMSYSTGGNGSGGGGSAAGGVSLGGGGGASMAGYNDNSAGGSVGNGGANVTYGGAGGGSAGARGGSATIDIYSPGGSGGAAISGKSFINGGAGLLAATVGGTLTQGTAYGSQG